MLATLYRACEHGLIVLAISTIQLQGNTQYVTTAELNKICIYHVNRTTVRFVEHWFSLKQTAWFGFHNKSHKANHQWFRSTNTLLSLTCNQQQSCRNPPPLIMNKKVTNTIVSNMWKQAYPTFDPGVYKKLRCSKSA